jgi:hypothetical protein
MPNTAIDNTTDILDSRDIIARIEELTDERDSFVIGCPAYGVGMHGRGEECATCNGNGEYNATPADWAAVNPEDAEELATLTALAEEAEGYAPDWTHGETLIRDSYFTEYAMGLLADCGDLPRELPHYIVIDEDATARNIRMDYTAVEFGDVTYWIR